MYSFTLSNIWPNFNFRETKSNNISLDLFWSHSKSTFFWVDYFVILFNTFCNKFKVYFKYAYFSHLEWFYQDVLGLEFYFLSIILEQVFLCCPFFNISTSAKSKQPPVHRFFLEVDRSHFCSCRSHCLNYYIVQYVSIFSMIIFHPCFFIPFLELHIKISYKF